MSHDEPCVIFALDRESQAFRHRPAGKFPGAPGGGAFYQLPGGGRVLVLHSGIGRVRMERAVEWVLSRPAFDGGAYAPKLVVSAGFAGALDESVALGDVVVADEVTDGGHVWRTTWPGGLPGAALRRGKFLTWGKLVAKVEEKAALGTQHGAVAVEMESAAVAKACAGRGVKFGCVRAISDDVRTELSPRLVSLFAGGHVSIPKVIAAVCKSPALAGELWRLAGHTRLAGRKLAEALGSLLAERGA